MVSSTNLTETKCNFKKYSLLGKYSGRVVIRLSGNGVGHINEVALHRARLVRGWVTISVFNFPCGKFVSI